MPQLLHCDVARKAGSLVWLCCSLDSGNPARRNPMERRFLASDTFVCLLQSAFHLWSAGKWVPVVTEPRMWTCVCVYVPQFGSQHGAVAAHTQQGCAPGAHLMCPGCWRTWHSVLWSHAHSSSRPTAGLESILISTCSLHLICHQSGPLPQIRELTLSKVPADKG